MFKNMKLGTKIIGMISVILLLMVISSGFGIIKMGEIGNELKTIAEEDMPLTKMITEITINQLEQSNGIEQVNVAIFEMDKVVQQNAANAEETASGSEEMSAQAEQLKDYVGDLVALVTGKKDQDIITNGIQTLKTVPHFSKPSAPTKKKMLPPNTKEVRPDHIIPFDDNENFKDF